MSDQTDDTDKHSSKRCQIWGSAKPTKEGLIHGYDVGYGKPPRETQFKKGQSGNPAGRPRKNSSRSGSAHRTGVSNSRSESIRKELLREITVQDGGKPKKMSLEQAAIRSQTKLAFSGSPMATREMIKITRQAREELEEEIADDNDFWTGYCEKFHAVEKAREVQCDPLPQWWPRPEDITVRHGEETVIHGPSSEEEFEGYLQIARVRDLFIAHWAYQAVMFRSPKRAHTSDQDESDLLIIAYLMNQMQPQRLRLGPDEIDRRLFDGLIQSRSVVTARFEEACKQAGLDPATDQPPSMLGQSCDLPGIDVNAVRVWLAEAKDRHRAKQQRKS